MTAQRYTLGIIGTGNLMQSWIKTLTTEDLPQIGGIVFYERLQNEESKARRESLYKMLNEKNLAPKINKHDLSNFNTFYDSADMILLAAGGSLDKQVQSQLLAQLQKKMSSLKEKDSPLAPKTYNDLDSLLADANGVSHKDLFDIDSAFLNNESPDQIALSSVIEAKKQGFFPFGFRMIADFPANVPVVLNYAQEFNHALSTRKPKPVIVACNEPALCSSLLAASCPQLIPYIYGLSSIDSLRLEEILGEEYKVLLKGNPSDDLHVTVIGDHDGYMLPELSSNDAQGYSERAQFLKQVDLQQLYTALRPRLPAYYFEIGPDKAREHTKKSITALVQGICKSLDSLWPTSLTGHALFTKYGDIPDGKGLFLAGTGSTQYGKSSASPPVLTGLIKQEMEECRRAHIFLLKALSERLNKNMLPQDYTPSIQISQPEAKRSAESAAAYLESTGECFIIGAGKEVKTLRVKEKSLQETASYNLGHHATSLNVVYLEERVPLIMMGYSRGIKVINYKQPEEAVEVDISFNCSPINSEDRLNLGINMATMYNDNLLVSVPHIGALHIPWQKILEKKFIAIQQQDIPLYCRPDKDFLLAAEIEPGSILLASANICTLEEQGTQQAQVELPQGEHITALTCADGKGCMDIARSRYPVYEISHQSPHGLSRKAVRADAHTQDKHKNIYAGTSKGNIYRLDMKEETTEKIFWHSSDGGMVQTLVVSDNRIYFNQLYKGGIGLGVTCVSYAAPTTLPSSEHSYSWFDVHEGIFVGLRPKPATLVIQDLRKEHTDRSYLDKNVNDHTGLIGICTRGRLL